MSMFCAAQQQNHWPLIIAHDLPLRNDSPALHLPRGGHMIQAMTFRPSHLEICTLRGGSQPNIVGADSALQTLL